MGNKVALALLALAASIVVAGCGGTQEADLAGTSPTSPARPVRLKHTNPRKSCDARGINATQLGVGACTERGIQYVVANYGGVVKLRTIGVTITSVSVAPADQGGGRTVRPQRDAFLRMTLQIQNRDKVPHRFAYGQTMLGIGADNYLETVEVERQVHTEALAKVNGGLMGPGETLHGDVLFDITEADYRELQSRGRFFIWNFGDRASPQFTRRVGQIGQIRLYAGEAAPSQQSGRG